MPRQPVDAACAARVEANSGVTTRFASVQFVAQTEKRRENAASGTVMRVKPSICQSPNTTPCRSASAGRPAGSGPGLAQGWR